LPSLVLSAWSVVSYFLRYFSSTSTEQISGFRRKGRTVAIEVRWAEGRGERRCGEHYKQRSIGYAGACGELVERHHETSP
jgi:hypothetical protein